MFIFKFLTIPLSSYLYKSDYIKLITVYNASEIVETVAKVVKVHQNS